MTYTYTCKSTYIYIYIYRDIIHPWVQIGEIRSRGWSAMVFAVFFFVILILASGFFFVEHVFHCMENPGFSILILHHGEGPWLFEGPKKRTQPLQNHSPPTVFGRTPKFLREKFCWQPRSFSCPPKEVYMKPGRGCLSLVRKEAVWRFLWKRRPVRVKHSALAAFFFGAEFSKALLEARPIQTSLEGFESLKIGTSLELGVCLFA